MAIRQYEDILIRIDAEPERGQGYPVSIIRSPGGETETDIRMPLRIDEPPLSDELAALECGECDDVRLKTIGNVLFNALFDDSYHVGDKRRKGRIYEIFARSIAQATATPDGQVTERGLRIRLDIRASELHSVPWELLLPPDKDRFLAFDPATPLTRYLTPSSDVVSSSTLAPPLRLLHILVDQHAPNSFDTIDTKIRQALDPLGNKVRVTTVRNPDLTTFRTHMLRGGGYHSGYHIIHYTGPVVLFQGQACLPLSDDGPSPRMNSDVLVRYLERRPTRLVVFSGSPLAQELGATLVRAGVPAAVTMQAEMSRDEAICFAESFYAVLADYYPIEFAVHETRIALYTQFGKQNGSWRKPMLFMIGAGQFFDLAEANRVPPARSEEELAKIEEYRLAIDAHQAVVDDIIQKMHEGNQDVWSLLEAQKEYRLGLIAHFKRLLIEMGATYALPGRKEA